MPKKFEEMKNAILREGKFALRKGEKPEQAAYAIATAAYKKMKAKKGKSMADLEAHVKTLKG